MSEKGTISIHTENIFPIIKKFLYSDHEIFLRELVSNAIDATQKIKRLASLGEYNGELGELRVEVSFDEEAKTITVSDKGIGMTADEIKKYINQIAFSGATEFVEKYKDKGDEQQIIGHFGLGFYSAFMVADKVEIVTQSYQDGTTAARWICDGSTEFEISEVEKAGRGTDIILHIAEDSEEFINKGKIQGILDKYSKFMPIPIKFGDKDKSVEDGEDEEGKKKYKTIQEDNIINNTTPLWTRSPSELKDEDYLAFYKELYPFAEDPLFWIHLNVDYPFNLTGILYFPKIKKEMEVQKNKIQLYSRQVFITDEVKDVVPEFLMLLHGVIDSPDIPLNVSRSFLQADGNVKKINTYITKKVADKLAELFKNDRTAYQEKWNDIGVFVKYGMISETKFDEKAVKFLLLENTEGEFATLEEYKEKIKPNQTDKDDKVVALYTTDVDQQFGYIDSAKNRAYDVIKLDSVIDAHFINHLEQKGEFTLKRVDADVMDKLIQKEEEKESVLSEEESTQLKELFEKVIDKKNATVVIESMATDDLPVIVTMPEFMRRMKDMSAMGGGGGMFMMGGMEDQLTVSVNANHELIGKALKSEDEATKESLVKHTFDLAMLHQGMLSGADLSDFIKRSVDLVK